MWSIKVLGGSQGFYTINTEQGCWPEHFTQTYIHPFLVIRDSIVIGIFKINVLSFDLCLNEQEGGKENGENEREAFHPIIDDVSVWTIYNLWSEWNTKLPFTW